MLAKDFLMVALDFSSFSQAQNLVEELDDQVSFYKVGMQLFYAEGEKILSYLNQKNKKVFLDLKLNDIPATVSLATQSLAALPIDYLTLFSESEQVAKARNTLDKLNSPIKILNVTVLTSQESNQEQVLLRSAMSQKAGAHGVVCSGLETKLVREQSNDDFLIVNPGIRRHQDDSQDQKRIVTPQLALKNGASHIVMGRPITLSPKPKQTAQQILQELSFI